MPSVCRGVCIHVCICHIFKSSFISHSVMKIFSPNLESMLIAVKIMVLILKKHGRHR